MPEITLQQAIEKLRAELKKDQSTESYFFTWQANISMTIMDELVCYGLLIEGTKLYTFFLEGVNNGTKKFLELLIDFPND